MAAKKEAAPLRGAKLMKKAIDAGKGGGILTSPEPLGPLARKLKLPNGEPISPAMKELLAFDGSWLSLDYDEDEAEIEAISLEEIVEEHFGAEAVQAFAEAYDMLPEDCVLLCGERERPACLYIGVADAAGEYPVLTLSWDDGVARIGGFVPFDVWAAQELGALERGKDIGDVPHEYVALPRTAAEENGDGRIVFSPKAGGGAGAAGEDDEDEDDDEDDEDEDDEDLDDDFDDEDEEDGDEVEDEDDEGSAS